MRIDGQLIRAQLEVVAGAVANIFVGRTWFDKTAEKIKVVDSGGTTRSVVTEDQAQTLTNKTIDADGAGNSITNIENADIKAAAAIAVNKLAAVTVSRALVSDASGFVSPATTTSAEIGYVNGVTSAIQTQLDARTAKATLTAKGSLYAASAASTPAEVTVGANDTVLTADTAQATGVKWATVSSLLGTNGTGELTNLGIAASVAASALTIALKQSDGSTNCAAGAAACKIAFRNATSATGGFNTRSVTAALSVVVSSGSTLGHASALAAYVYVYAIDNAGTVELAVSGQKLFDEGSVVTTTAEGGAGAADSATVLYSTTARANVPCRLIGRVAVTQATAGTWATAPSEISIVPFENTRNLFVAQVSASPGSTSANTPLIFPTASRNPNGAYSTITGKYTTLRQGWYQVSVHTQSSFNAGNYLYVSVNGSTSVSVDCPIIAVTQVNNGLLSGSTLVHVPNIGNTIDIRPVVASTGGASTDHMGIVWLGDN